MTTAGSRTTPASDIDTSRWTHHRLRVADNEPGHPSSENGVYLHGISCPPPKGMSRKGAILLLHGFPHTSYEFRRVITPLANAGYHVLAPDCRGAGSSSKPLTGYTKDVMARDVRTLLQRLGVTDQVHLVGHDIGAAVAHSYAAQFPQEVASIVQADGPMLGSQVHHSTKNSRKMWHFAFHAVPDIPEALIQGRERIYLKYFFDRLLINPDAINAHDLDVYTASYEQPGAMRAALNWYRCFEQDGRDNVRRLKESGKRKLRLLSLWGSHGLSDEASATSMMGEFYESVQFQAIPGAGHHIPEEKPREFVDALLQWYEKSHPRL